MKDQKAIEAQILYHAMLGANLVKNSKDQYEAIERKFLIETKKDIVDKVNLDYYFTELVILLDNLTQEYKELSNLILEKVKTN